MTDSNFIKPLDSFVSEVINYLPDYLRKDNLVKFMTVFLDRLEALDNSFIQLAEYRLLVNAQGVVLDDIGTQMLRRPLLIAPVALLIFSASWEYSLVYVKRNW